MRRVAGALWLVLWLCALPVWAQEQAPQEQAPPAPIQKPLPAAAQREAVTTRHTLALGDESLDYVAEIGTVIVTAGDGERQGEMFYTAYRLTGAEPRDRALAFSRALQEEGVRVNQRCAWFLSAAHDSGAIEETLEAADRALAAI